MPDLTVWPTDGADGSVSSEARWRKMARLWVPSGVANGMSLISLAGPAITVNPGAAWLDGHFAELSSPQTVAASANGLLVLRFTPADNRCELLYRDGAGLSPTRTDATWELALASMSAGAMYDHRAHASTNANGAPIVGALPAFPFDGQVVNFWNGSRLWELTYYAAAPAPYRWCFTGGAPIHAEVPTAEPCAVTGGWVELATGGPILTISLPGIYRFGFGFQGVAWPVAASSAAM